jgi:predicted HTH transcriptional regulator
MCSARGPIGALLARKLSEADRHGAAISSGALPHSAPSSELRPISGATLVDLDRRRLTDYFGRIRQQEVPADDDGWITLLVNTEIMVEDGVTAGGVLLFGTNPNRFLPQAGVDAAAFPGTEKDYAARERVTIRGPMTPLFGTDGQLIENGLIEQALEFIRHNTPVTAVLEDGGDRPRKRVIAAITQFDVSRTCRKPSPVGGCLNPGSTAPS